MYPNPNNNSPPPWANFAAGAGANNRTILPLPWYLSHQLLMNRAYGQQMGNMPGPSGQPAALYGQMPYWPPVHVPMPPSFTVPQGTVPTTTGSSVTVPPTTVAQSTVLPPTGTMATVTPKTSGGSPRIGVSMYGHTVVEGVSRPSILYMFPSQQQQAAKTTGSTTTVARCPPTVSRATVSQTTVAKATAYPRATVYSRPTVLLAYGGPLAKYALRQNFPRDSDPGPSTVSQRTTVPRIATVSQPQTTTVTRMTYAMYAQYLAAQARLRQQRIPKASSSTPNLKMLTNDDGDTVDKDTVPEDTVAEDTVPAAVTVPGNTVADNIEIRLINEALWKEFDEHQNEMTVCREGRRLFPNLQYSITGLSPQEIYCLSIHFVLESNYKHRFHSRTDGWAEDVNYDDVIDTETNEVFSDEMSGEEVMLEADLMWAELKIYQETKWTQAFNKKKGITGKEDMVPVNINFKYRPVLRIYKCQDQQQTVIAEYSASETSFITVGTTYRSKKMAEMKKIGRIRAGIM